MEIIVLLLVVLAVVLLGLATLGVGSPRVALGWLGLCALAVVKLIEVIG